MNLNILIFRYFIWTLELEKIILFFVVSLRIKEQIYEPFRFCKTINMTDFFAPLYSNIHTPVPMIFHSKNILIKLPDSTSTIIL